MAQDTSCGSVVDQIVKQWFEELRQSDELDAETVRRLERLASRKRLRSPQELTEAIALDPGGSP